MHKIQKDLLSLSRNINIGDRSLRDIGKLIGVDHPEQVKHHLKQLEKKGFLQIDQINGIVRNVNNDRAKENKFINIPIVGSANCGPAVLLAEDNLSGYMKVSSHVLPHSGDFFAIKAIGDSMNKADIQGNSIQEGDIVIVDKEKNDPKNGKYMLVVIDNSAMIKKVKVDENQGIVLFISESTTDHPPIVASVEDLDEIYINGEVIQVVKT